MEFIQSTKNEHVKTWRKLQTHKGRQKTGSYLVEGHHLVEEALKQDGLVRDIILTEELYATMDLNTSDTNVFVVSKEVSHAISDTKTEQGIFAVVDMIDPELMLLYGKKFLLMDAVQDPGNLGTLIRTAEAAGYDAVIIGKGSADLYNPKVIRSAQGSHFHIPVLSGDLMDWIEQLNEEGVPIFGAVLDQEAKLYNEIKPQQTLALVVGNEGQGISDEVIHYLSQKVYIPIYGKSESLNVAIAAGILLYALREK
ncbi:RNA methyltransferase [Listeria sp. PSOL-1]|uniref:TrmH family RNA methyltransferase n=1 Tax=Listeria sp. PSOL-1 TaxID=1844999 RepID=UPI0013D3DB91|nr:RNA methyltransferase [Listeria sp. PSOL-1]